jgi:hypothetical protein
MDGGGYQIMADVGSGQAMIQLEVSRFNFKLLAPTAP